MDLEADLDIQIKNFGEGRLLVQYDNDEPQMLCGKEFAESLVERLNFCDPNAQFALTETGKALANMLFVEDDEKESKDD